MRWSHAYIGLAGATLGFGAVVLAASGAPPSMVAIPVGLAVAALGLMLWRTHAAEKVVVVGAPAGEGTRRFLEELDDAGFAVRACSGPVTRPCPALHGLPCPYTDHQVAAVVFHDPDRLLMPPCGRALGVRQLTIEQASDAAPAIERGGAVVGWDLGPSAAVHALRTILVAPGRAG